MTDSKFRPLGASCSCGASRLQVNARPFARFICHCNICQAFTGKPFSDMTVLRACDIKVEEGAQIEYRKYRLPPNIVRGSCVACGKPVIEFGLAGPAKLAFVPTSNYGDISTLPHASLHMFYHRRVKDVQDNLPQYSGYLRSQLAVMGLLIRGLFR